MIRRAFRWEDGWRCGPRLCSCDGGGGGGGGDHVSKAVARGRALEAAISSGHKAVGKAGNLAGGAKSEGGWTVPTGKKSNVPVGRKAPPKKAAPKKDRKKSRTPPPKRAAPPAPVAPAADYHDIDEVQRSAPPAAAPPAADPAADYHDFDEGPPAAAPSNDTGGDGTPAGAGGKIFGVDEYDVDYDVDEEGTLPVGEQQPDIDRKSLTDKDIFDYDALIGTQRDINNLREAARKGYLDGKVDQSVIDGLLSTHTGVAATIGKLLGSIVPGGQLLMDKAEFDPAARSNNLNLSPNGIAARTAALNDLLSGSLMGQINDQLEMDRPDGADTYGTTSASTKAVKSQMIDYPKQWFPPGADYNDDLFRNDDGSVKSDAQIDEMLREMWRNHAQGKGTTSGSNKIFGTNIDVGSLGPGVSSALRTLYEGGDYDRYRAFINAAGGETNLSAPWAGGQNYLPGPGWKATDMAEQYVDVNPGLAATWKMIDAVQKGKDTSQFADHPSGLTPEQQVEYWYKEAGDNNLTKEEFGQAHLAYTGSKRNRVPSGEHSISRTRRIFEWQKPEPPKSEPKKAKKEPEKEIWDSCFIEGVQVELADGMEKDVAEISVGDVVKTKDGEGAVVKVFHSKAAGQKLYGFNDKAPFVTAAHPFMTQDGWKKISEVQVGDTLYRNGLGLDTVESIESKDVPADTPVFNFHVDTHENYYAAGYLVHNKQTEVPETTGPTEEDVDDMVPVSIPPGAVTPSGAAGGDVSAAEGAASGGFKSALANLGPSGLPSGVSYLVPVRDKYTGKIRYVPQGAASYYSNWAGVGSGIPGVTMTPGYGWGRGRSTLPGGLTGRRAGWGSTITV